ncbi:MAG: AAA family ATPase [Roseburia sp.]|nr:AAA family ATPase [Roseburia sp.]
MAYLLLFFFAVLLVMFPLLRCFVFNIHFVVIYAVKDFIEYIIKRKWRIWNGFGMDIFVGMFGRGKSLAASMYVLSQAKRYKLHVLSNVKLYGYPYTELVNYQQIIDAPDNTIIFIDEISTVFNAREWKNFNINLLFQLLQCRKNKKKIVATAQRFGHVDKLIRDITANVVDCNKLWRFQNLKFYDAWDYENCMNTQMIRPVRRECLFIHDKHYHGYDTSELIDNVKRTDFKSNDEILVSRGVERFEALAPKHPSRRLKKTRKGR